MLVIYFFLANLAFNFCVPRLIWMQFADFGPLTYGDDELLPPDVRYVLRSVQYIAQHTKYDDRDIEASTVLEKQKRT